MTYEQALHVLEVLDGRDIANDELVRTAAIVGAQGLHKQLCDTLKEKRWVRGYGHETNAALRSTPWLSAWSDFVDAQIERINQVCAMTLSEGGAE